MIIQMTPQIRDSNKIWYEIEEQKIIVTINDMSDTFDFTDMPDGELRLLDDEGYDLINTELDEIPILSATKEDGVLTVEILFSVNIDEQDERLLFPEPMSLAEFNELMEEIAEREEEEEEEEEEIPIDELDDVTDWGEF